jgi:hypothetical protein
MLFDTECCLVPDVTLRYDHTARLGLRRRKPTATVM